MIKTSVLALGALIFFILFWWFWHVFIIWEWSWIGEWDDFERAMISLCGIVILWTVVIIRNDS